MQFIVISHQLYEIMLGVLVGLILGFVYDLFRFLRRFFENIKAYVLFTNFLDILFSMLVGSAYCIFIYYASNGRFRWFTAFAFVFGYSVYIVSASKLIRPVLFWIADGICNLLRIIIIPFKRIFYLIKVRILSLRKTIEYKNQKVVTENLKLQLCECVKLVDYGDGL